MWYHAFLDNVFVLSSFGVPMVKVKTRQSSVVLALNVPLVCEAPLFGVPGFTVEHVAPPHPPGQLHLVQSAGFG